MILHTNPIVLAYSTPNNPAVLCAEITGPFGLEASIQVVFVDDADHMAELGSCCLKFKRWTSRRFLYPFHLEPQKIAVWKQKQMPNTLVFSFRFYNSWTTSNGMLTLFLSRLKSAIGHVHKNVCHWCPESSRTLRSPASEGRLPFLAKPSFARWTWLRYSRCTIYLFVWSCNCYILLL